MTHRVLFVVHAVERLAAHARDCTPREQRRLRTEVAQHGQELGDALLLELEVGLGTVDHRGTLLCVEDAGLSSLHGFAVFRPFRLVERL